MTLGYSYCNDAPDNHDYGEPDRFVFENIQVVDVDALRIVVDMASCRENLSAMERDAIRIVQNFLDNPVGTITEIIQDERAKAVKMPKPGGTVAVATLDRLVARLMPPPLDVDAQLRNAMAKAADEWH